MNRSVVIVLSLMVLVVSSCQNKKSGKNDEVDTSVINNPATLSDKPGKNKVPIMTFEKTIHDFGQIREGERVSYSFKFTNTGTAPLVISNVVPSCGCTVPEWPKEPIAPGESEYITLIFDSKGRSGNFLKNVSIFANTIPNQTVLEIKGFIKK